VNILQNLTFNVQDRKAIDRRGRQGRKGAYFIASWKDKDASILSFHEPAQINFCSRSQQSARLTSPLMNADRHWFADGERFFAGSQQALPWAEQGHVNW